MREFLKRFWWLYASLVIAVAIGLLYPLPKEAEAQPVQLVLEAVIASAVDADGTFTTVTLSEASWDCTFRNLDSTATNTLDITINGGASAIRLYGGDSYNTNTGRVPILVSTFASAAVVGTPDVQYFCWGQ